MDKESALPPITVVGEKGPKGTYVLRIWVAEEMEITFGRFKKGKVVHVPAGAYLYVGSALGQGATSLGRRLVRHATRSGEKAPHAIRTQLLQTLPAMGIGQHHKLLPGSGKRLFWNVDYLLDQEKSTLTHVLIVCSPRRLETAVARFLENEPVTYILEKGLGANDSAGSTHLLGVRAPEAWWLSLPQKLAIYHDDTTAKTITGIE